MSYFMASQAVRVGAAKTEAGRAFTKISSGALV